jgi:hypothetical protein
VTCSFQKSRWLRRLFLAVCAGVGAGAFFLIDQMLLQIQLSPDMRRKLIFGVCFAFAISVLFLEKFLAAVRGLFLKSDDAENLPLFLMLALGLLNIMLGQLVDEAASMAREAAMRNIAVAIFAAGGVTLCWTLTDERHFRGAWLYGFCFGLFAGALLVFFSGGFTTARLSNTGDRRQRPFGARFAWRSAMG